MQDESYGCAQIIEGGTWLGAYTFWAGSSNALGNCKSLKLRFILSIFARDLSEIEGCTYCILIVQLKIIL